MDEEDEDEEEMRGGDEIRRRRTLLSHPPSNHQCARLLFSLFSDAGMVAEPAAAPRPAHSSS
eukprot:6711702-Pyramimonas_sp.AAC.1